MKSVSYKELRKALDFKKFIKFLENNNNLDFRPGSTYNCPISMYLRHCKLEKSSHYATTKLHVVYTNSETWGIEEITLNKRFSSFVSCYDASAYYVENVTPLSLAKEIQQLHLSNMSVVHDIMKKDIDNVN